MQRRPRKTRTGRRSTHQNDGDHWSERYIYLRHLRAMVWRCEPTDTFATAKSRRTLTQDSERVCLSWTGLPLGIQSADAHTLACGLT